MVFQDTTDWISTSQTFRVSKKLENITDYTAGVLGESNAKLHFDSDFKIQTEFFDYAQDDIAAHNRWLWDYPEKIHTIIDWSEVEARCFQIYLRVNKFTELKMGQVSKLLSKLRAQVSMKPLITIEDYEEQLKEDG